MELKDAIDHARDVGIKMMSACETRKCGKEHLQLAKWLEELQLFRKIYGTPPKQDNFI